MFAIIPQAIEHAIGIGDRPLARSPIEPAFLAGLQLEADPANALRRVDEAIDQNIAAMLAIQLPVVPHRLDFDPGGGRLEPYCATPPSMVGRCLEHIPVGIDRRIAVRRGGLRRRHPCDAVVAPEERPILRGHREQPAAGHVHNLPHVVVFDENG
jgi:hypothetical protein